MAAWSALPAAPTLKSLVEVLLDSPGFFTMFWNSVMISLGVLGGQLLTAVPAAWALARFPLRGKKRILTAYIVLMLMVPKDWKQLKVTYVPTFLEGKSLTFVMNASDVIRS